MQLNILLRGQSNSILLNDSGGMQVIVAALEGALGFDGTTNRINLIGNSQTAPDAGGDATEYGGTSFLPSATSLGNWVAPVNGDPAQGFTDGALETAMLRHLRGLPDNVRAAPTVVLWMHDESDSMTSGLTTAEWEAAVRHDATEVRAALGGQSAATVPYGFVDVVPFDPGLAASMQAIKVGMADLVADPTFDGFIAAHAGDMDMDNPYNGLPAGRVIYGGPHMSALDLSIVTRRILNALLPQLGQYALPGSPWANGYRTDATGPSAVSAALLPGRTTVLVDVALDPASTGLLQPGPAAASGLGWTVLQDGVQREATAARLLPGNRLLLSFDAPLAADSAATLFYDYGTGRLAAGAATHTGPGWPGTGPGSPGEGNGIYDTAAMPLWARPTGLAVAQPGIGGDTGADPSAIAAAIGGPAALAAFQAAAAPGLADGTAVDAGTVVLVPDASGQYAAAGRLYLTITGSNPDPATMVALGSVLEGGTPPEQLAAQIAAQAGLALDGSDDAALFGAAYRNALGRPMEGGRLGQLADAIANGATREQALVGIACSPESIGHNAATYADAGDAAVQRLYKAALGLDITPVQAASAIATTTGSLVDALAASPAFLAAMGTATTADLVKDVYANAFGRVPEAAGLASWSTALDSGAITRAGFLEGVANSLELRNGTAGTTHDGYVVLSR